MVHENTATTSVYDYDDKLKIKNGLPEKRFVLRESLLTVLFENPHVKTIHHMAVALFLGLFLTTIIRDYYENYGFKFIHIISHGFGKLPIALLGWVIYYIMTCCTYFCFKLWAFLRLKLSPSQTTLKKCLDLTFLSLLLAYIVFCFHTSGHIVRKYKLAPASAAILLMEQTRNLMKIYAFVRHNSPKVLNFKQKSDKQLKLPTFRYFLYFSMVPTLVYRDEYPRTSRIRWKLAATYLIEICGVMLLYSCTIQKFISPLYKDFGIRKITYVELFVILLETSFIGILYLLSTFYLVLHLVQNFFAEILRFGDRMFYKDWWTATDYAAWFRTWNVVVHDWLYTYLYKDIYAISKNKILAKYGTFLISAIVHEWIVMYMFGFFFPVMFALYFICSPFMTFLKGPKNSFISILFWLGLCYGTGFLVSGYILEFYARLNGVKAINEDLDFYIPRCLTCDCFV